MDKVSKMDLHGARTAADVERKYNFGKSFAEAKGIATDARDAASAARAAVGRLDAKLDHNEIFNRLTNNGAAHGIYRDDDGEIYINARYIKSGEYAATAEAFLEPGDEEIEIMQGHVRDLITIPDNMIPLYDFNNDGEVTSLDLDLAKKAKLGTDSLADWSGAVKTPVTCTINPADPVKAIRISGQNMWGRTVDGYIGMNGATFRNVGTADFVVEEGVYTYPSEGADPEIDWCYRKWNSGIAECWGGSSLFTPITTAWGSLYRSDWNKNSLQYPSDIGFISPPQEFVTVSPGSSNGAAVWVFQNKSNGQTWSGAYHICRPMSVADGDSYFLDYYVIGQWK